MPYALQGDDTIDLRLAMFQHQQEVLKQQMAELQHTIEMVDYKCWYYETTKEAGTVDAPQKMELSEVPERFRKIWQELRTVPGGCGNDVTRLLGQRQSVA